jgi:putative oxidoreductase
LNKIRYQRLINFLRSAPNLDRLQCTGQLILRVYIGTAVLIAHGWPKLQGMLSGHSRFPMLVGRLGFPFPDLFAWMVVAAQIGASLLVILGLWTRTMAICVGFTIAFGVLNVHWHEGFKGMELGLIYALVFAVIVVSGPGRLSLDRMIQRASNEAGD